MATNPGVVRVNVEPRLDPGTHTLLSDLRDSFLELGEGIGRLLDHLDHLAVTVDADE